MAELVLTDAYVSLDANDLSDHVKSITINYSAEGVDITAMGDLTHNRIAGLKDWSVDIEFNQDYAAANLDSILFPLVGTTFTFAARPTSAVVSTSNPSYGGTVLLESYSPMSGAVGDAATTSISLTAAGTLGRTTA